MFGKKSKRLETRKSSDDTVPEDNELPIFELGSNILDIEPSFGTDTAKFAALGKKVLWTPFKNPPTHPPSLFHADIAKRFDPAIRKAYLEGVIGGELLKGVTGDPITATDAGLIEVYRPRNPNLDSGPGSVPPTIVTVYGVSATYGAPTPEVRDETVALITGRLPTEGTVVRQSIFKPRHD